MSTILFEKIVFGPIRSRRLGSSLGVNLLPLHGKLCTFDCIYCECGWNKDGKNDTRIYDLQDIEKALTERLNSLKNEGTVIDTITFSGNGEPTLHPHFPEIIDLTIKLRDSLYPEAKISVLSNASRITKDSVRDALLKVDNPILKIDSAIGDMVDAIDRPQPGYSLERTIERLKEISGRYILQTMFLRGEHDGKTIDCTSEENVRTWQNLVRELRPRSVMIYTIDRETPEKNLSKVTVEEMNAIAEPLRREGFTVQVNG